MKREEAVPHGIIPALVTPFDERDEIDFLALKRLVERVIAAGVHGLFVAGGQGEFYALTPEEHEATVAAAVAAASGRVPVLAGASAASTRSAVLLAQRAEASGATAIVLLPPFVVQPSEPEIEQHFDTVAAAVQVPLILYNHPGRTGISLGARLVSRLAEGGRFNAIKDSSGDLSQTAEYIDTRPNGFSVLVGNDALVAYGLLAGANGAVASTANVVPELCVAIYDSVCEGAVQEACRLQASLTRLRRAFALGTFPVVVKEALTLMGEGAGRCRAPVTPLSLPARETLRQILIDLGCIAVPEGVRS